MPVKFVKKETASACRTCRRSSVVGSQCAFENLKEMCYCPTYIKIRPKVSFKK